MLGFLRRHYLSIDPRTLGLLRIALACLLLVDLVKRSAVLRLFYVNSGLIPNHRVLWRPPREHMFSFLLALSDVREVQIAFGLIALVYLCLLIGYRTRLMQVLAWLSLISLQTRADILSSGADFVFGILLLWSAFLPLGRRFSVDALLHSLRTGADHDLASLQEFAKKPRDTEPVVSLAVLALSVQLAVIYFFNTVHKNGPTWRDGTAVYWLVHQERIVTWLGFAAREALPLWVFQALSYLTLIVEGALPLLILSPFGRPWTRRLALVSIIGLHSGMALLSNLGLFSPVMMVYGLSFVESRDWELWQARGRRVRAGLRVLVDVGCGLCFQLARVLTRLDVFGRIELQAEPAADSCGYVQLAGGGRVQHEPALRKLLRVLPLGLLWVALAQLLRPFTGPAVRWMGRNRAWLSGQLALSPASAGPAPQLPAAAPGPRRVRYWLGELCVLGLIMVAFSQMLVENPAISAHFSHEQSRAVRTAIGYLRLNQGWSMFAPDAPTSDLFMVVDAVTEDGRHIDPWNDRASRLSDPSLRTIPARLSQDAAYCDYSSRIADDGVLHEPLRDWILNHHHRTHRPEDRIHHFKAYVIEQDNPAPGEQLPSHVRTRVFLRE